MIVRPGTLQIELDGDGVSPSTVEARSLLDLASTLIELIGELGKDADQPVTFRGLAVQDKCIALATTVSPPDMAEDLSREALVLVAGQDSVDRGFVELVARARQAVNALPLGITPRIIVGSWSGVVKSAPSHDFGLTKEVTELRVRVVRAGGAGRMVRLHSVSEPKDFSLHASEELCRKLGAHLYQDVDVVAEILRTANGVIDGGEVHDVFEVLGSGGGDFRTWLADAAGDWAGVTDVLKEIGRRD